MGVDRTFDYVPSLEADLAAIRSKLAASDLERIRLRAALREALDAIERFHSQTNYTLMSDAEVAELRKLVQP